MKIPYFVIDAFTGDGLKGNPAGVCVLPSSLKPQLMQEIAARNNLPETAFICRQATGWSIRWFTPTFEIDLCGHATLAAAFAVLNFYELQAEMVKFMAGCGCLTVRRCGNGYELALPAKMPQEIAVTDEMRKALGLQPLKAWQDRDLYLLLQDENAVKNFVPDYNKLQKLNKWLGIVITACGQQADFASRYFCPELQDEDPVTGSAHCCLVPLWAKALGKTKLRAVQLSPRGGDLFCSLDGDTICLGGQAKIYLKGEIYL